MILSVWIRGSDSHGQNHWILDRYAWSSVETNTVRIIECSQSSECQSHQVKVCAALNCHIIPLQLGFWLSINYSCLWRSESGGDVRLCRQWSEACKHRPNRHSWAVNDAHEVVDGTASGLTSKLPPVKAFSHRDRCWNAILLETMVDVFLWLWFRCVFLNKLKFELLSRVFSKLQDERDR